MNPVFRKAGAGLIMLLALLLSVSALVRYFVLDPVEGNAIIIDQGLTMYTMQYKPWNYALYLHILTAAAAIAIGPFQFMRRLRTRKPALHRNLGKTYIAAILISGLTGVYLSFYAFGGLISQAGFLALSIAWLYTTYIAYKRIREKKISQHEEWMYRSYAVTLVAITFRIWSAVIGFSFDNFALGYVSAIWLALIGNLAIAELFIRARRTSVPKRSGTLQKQG